MNTMSCQQLGNVTFVHSVMSTSLVTRVFLLLRSQSEHLIYRSERLDCCKKRGVREPA